ncbi:hypothetical protein IP87_18105, partial [beta proteobacterium AAP121]
MSVARPQFPATTATQGLALVRATAAPRRRGRHALRPVSLAVCLLGASPLGFALPEGATPTHGQVTVQTTAPGQMLIQQSTARAGLDWTNFSIAAGERVQVLQPDRSSVLLNRVLGDNPSLIYGALQSNGSVWLINPRGIVFGANSRVDVGGLVASTLTISDEALLSGRLQFGVGAGGAGELRSEGQITAIDGTVALVAPQLFHSGQIEARRVALAAASEVLVDVEGDGLVLFNVKNQALDTRLQMLGSVRADGGSAEFRAAARAGFADTVLNLDGVVQARSLGQLMGRVVVDGGAAGITQVGGSIDATSAQGRGGDVLVQGDKILLTDNARLDVSGTAGGGRLRVGGGFQGRDDTVRNASMVSVTRGARLSANALQLGDGGELIVWSDDATRFLGAADARGGIAGGHGGFVEISGKHFLDFRGTSDRSAPLGIGGQLLLDPTNLEIAADTPDIDGSASPATNDLTSLTLLFAAPGDNSRITAGAVQTQLGLGNVVLQANELITVSAAISAPAATNSLTLQAGHGIVVNAPISTAGSVTLSANTPGATAPLSTASVAVNQAITLTGAGVLELDNNGGSGTHTLAANVTASGLNLKGSTSLTAVADVATLTVNSGTLTLAAVADRIADTAAVTVAGGATLSLGVAETVGTLGLTGTLGGAAALNATSATLSGGTVNSNLTASGDVTVTGAGTSTVLADLNANNILVNNGSTLQVGNGGATGSLTATVSLGVGTGGVLAFNRSGTTDLGAVAGAGTVRVDGGTLRLTATLPDVTTVSVLNGGTLLLDDGSDNRINNAATLSVAAGGTLTLGDSGEAVGTLALGGTLSTSAQTLTATTYNLLTGATVNAPLGAGTLNAQGNATLNAASAATTVTVSNGATLTRSATGDLDAGATVTVNSGGVLTLAADDEITSLSLAGTLTGAGRLTTGTAELTASTVGAALTVTGDLTSSGASVLQAVVSAVNVNVNGGSLAIGNGGGVGELTPSGALTVAPGAALVINRTGAVSLNNVLGGGELQITNGAVTLDGTLPALAAVAVNGGSLSLANGESNRINNSASVSLAAGTTLSLGDSAETIGALTLNGGTVAGAAALTVQGNLAASGSSLLTTTVNVTGLSNVATGGTLTVGSGTTGNLVPTGTVTLTGTGALAYNADGPFVLGAVAGTGSIAVSKGALTINGNAAGLTGLTITGGSALLAGGAAQLGSNLAISVATGATFTLGSNAESVGSLTLGGVLGATTGVLTAGSYTLNTNAEVLGGLGAGNLSVQGNATINSAVNANVSVAAGQTLQLGSNANLAANATVTVPATATLALGVNTDTVQTLDLGGTLSGGATRTLAATTHNLQGGATVNARLGGTTVNVAGPGTVALQQALNGITGININGGTLNLTANGLLPSNANLTVDSSATLLMNGTADVDTLALRGTVSGTNTLSVQTFNATLNGSMPLIETTVSVTNNATVSNGVTLTLGGSGASAGALPVGGTLTLGGTLVIDRDTAVLASTLLGGGNNIGDAGAGVRTLRQAGTGTFTLDKNVTGLRLIESTGSGGLTLTTGSNLSPLATVTVGNGSVFTMGSTDDTVATLNLSGTLAGSGTLTASAANIPASATATLTGNLDAPVSISAGAQLTLGAASSIANGRDITVGDLGTLVLGRNETIDDLTLAGTLQGNFTLTASGGSQLLTNAVVATGTTLGGGTLTVTGDATLNGVSTHSTVNIGSAGNLRTGAAERLSNTATVDINTTGFLTLGGAETIGELQGEGEVVDNGFQLLVDVVRLNNQTRNNNFSAGSLISDGSSRIHGVASVSGAVLVNSGTLTVGNGASNGALNVTGVGTISIAATATLAYDRASGSITLDDNYTGAGTFQNANGASLVMTGTLGTDNVLLSGGNMTVSNALGSNTALTVNTGRTLTINNTVTAASLALSGTLNGSGTLTANSYTLNNNADVSLALGTGTLNVAGSATLRAAKGNGTVNVQNGGSL